MAFRVSLSVGALLVCVVALAGCGGGSKKSLSPDAARRALQAAGWVVKDGAGMAPISGGRQLAWFELRSPAGAAISVQFLEDADHARKELAAIRAGTPAFPADARFQGTTIGNALAFVSPAGHGAIQAADLAELRKLLGAG